MLQESNPQNSEFQTVIRTLLLTDLVDSTKLVERLGDQQAARINAQHDKLARDLLPGFGGQEIDKTDGFLFLFDRPLDAVRYSLAYHKALHDLSGKLDVILSARAGIHLGEITLHRNSPEVVQRGAKPVEVEGIAKPMAARVMSVALGGQTLLTKSAFDLARRAVVGNETVLEGAVWLEHGLYVLKGVEEPLVLCEVGFQGVSPLSPPPDSEKVKRKNISDESDLPGWRPAVNETIPGRLNWKLIKKLAESPRGEVWLGHQKGTRRAHVFKFIFERDHLKHLKKEAAILQVIKDKLGERRDITSLHDFRLDSTPYYIELDYSPQGSLADWAETKGGLDRVPLGRRLEIVAQVAEALGAAHSLGVIHKALQPSNILIEEKPDLTIQVRLTDFGEGRLLDKDILLSTDFAHITITHSGMTKSADGTLTAVSLLYVAPELFDGDPPDVKSDVYSLGILLYQMVLGRLNRPFRPGWEDTVQESGLVEVITQATASTRDARLDSAAGLAKRLQERISDLGSGEVIPERDITDIPLTPGQDQDPGTLSYVEAAEEEQQRIGDYVIIRQIGEGGFGRVYLATNPVNPNKLFALKVLSTEAGRDQLGSALTQELRHIDQLVHQNIVQNRGFGLHSTGQNKDPYLVMDYIEGPNGASFTLEDYLQTKGWRLPEKEILRLFKQILDALCYVHQGMIAHLDLKPRNILLDKNLKAYVSDFGISAAVHTASVGGKTVSESKGWTPHYAPLEQSHFGQGSRRSDVYALGVVLLVCLTGRLPESVPSQTAPQVNYIPPSAYDCDPRWDPIVAKCLSPDPALRYETACEMLQAIHQVESSIAAKVVRDSKSHSIQTLKRRLRAFKEAKAKSAPIYREFVVSVRNGLRKTVRATFATLRTTLSWLFLTRLGWAATALGVTGSVTAGLFFGPFTGSVGVRVAPKTATWTLTGRTKIEPQAGDLEPKEAKTGRYTLRFDPIENYIPPKEMRGILLPGIPLIFDASYTRPTPTPSPSPTFSPTLHPPDTPTPIPTATECVVGAPNLVGLSVQQAKENEIIRKGRLTIREEEPKRHDAKVPADLILDQIPQGGDIPCGSQISLVISAGPAPTETPTPSQTASPTASETPKTPTATSTGTGTPSRTRTATATPIPTDTPTHTRMPTDTPTDTPEPSPTPTTPTATPTRSASPTATGTETPTPSPSPTPTTPTATPTRTMSPSPTPSPTNTPSLTPSNTNPPPMTEPGEITQAEAEKLLKDVFNSLYQGNPGKVAFDSLVLDTKEGKEFWNSWKNIQSFVNKRNGFPQIKRQEGNTFEFELLLEALKRTIHVQWLVRLENGRWVVHNWKSKTSP